MEERRKQDGRRDDFLEKFFKLEVAVQRLTEHEKLDRPKYEQWHKETSERLVELEKLHLERANGRLRELENRAVVVHLTEKEIKVFFNEWVEVFAGRTFFKLVLSISGALGLIIAIGALGLFAYFKR